MSAELVRLVEERFEAFAFPYLQLDGDTYAYALKVAHTKRVLGIAAEISQSEGFAPELDAAARLSALMHDVGRFPQYKQYRTFRDADSANHAGLSVQHALRHKLLADVPVPLRRLVLGAVYLHNKRTLPSLASASLDTVARAIRDSDKLDIYSVMLAHFSEDKPKHPEVALHVQHVPEAFSQKTVDCLRRREAGDYKDVVYVNDFKLMAVGWLYDLNFRSSVAMLARRGYIDALFATLPKAPAIDELRHQIDSDLAQRLQGA